MWREPLFMYVTVTFGRKSTIWTPPLTTVSTCPRIGIWRPGHAGFFQGFSRPQSRRLSCVGHLRRVVASPTSRVPLLHGHRGVLIALDKNVAHSRVDSGCKNRNWRAAAQPVEVFPSARGQTAEWREPSIGHRAGSLLYSGVLNILWLLKLASWQNKQMMPRGKNSYAGQKSPTL